MQTIKRQFIIELFILFKNKKKPHKSKKAWGLSNIY